MSDSLTVSPYASQLFQPIGGVTAKSGCAAASQELGARCAPGIQKQKIAHEIERRNTARRVRLLHGIGPTSAFRRRFYVTRYKSGSGVCVAPAPQQFESRTGAKE